MALFHYKMSSYCSNIFVLRSILSDISIAILGPILLVCIAFIFLFFDIFPSCLL